MAEFSPLTDNCSITPLTPYKGIGVDIKEKRNKVSIFSFMSGTYDDLKTSLTQKKKEKIYA